MSPIEALRKLENLTDEQVLQSGRESLERDYGVYGLARYISLHHKRTGNYTEDRHAWQEKLTSADLGRMLKEAADRPR